MDDRIATYWDMNYLIYIFVTALRQELQNLVYS